MAQSGNDDQGDFSFAAWATGFRAAAVADDLALFREHLRQLGLPDEPQLLLDGTIHFVAMWFGFYSLGGDSEGLARLLQMQTYDPAEAIDACYAYTFNLCHKAYARVLLDTKFQNLDLADLFEAPWDAYRVAGYSEFYISRLDEEPLTDEERAELQDEIKGDLFYDYTEDELQVLIVEEDWDGFDDSYMRVMMQEIPECDREDYRNDDDIE